MRKFGLYFLFLSTTTLSYCQEVKLVVKKGDDFVEEYQVLKEDKEKKHGSYVKFTNDFLGLRILESGLYENGLKSGPWEYFRSFGGRATRNSLKERGSYVYGKRSGLWTAYYADTVGQATGTKSFGKRGRPDSIMLRIEQGPLKLKRAGIFLNDKRIGEWVSFDERGEVFQKYNFTTSTLIEEKSLKDSLEWNRNRIPLYIGGRPALIDFLTDEFQHRKMMTIKKDSISIIVSFKIDAKGQVSQPQTDAGPGGKVLTDELLRLINLTDGHWIPALSNGQKIDANYQIQFSKTRMKTAPYKGAFVFSFTPFFD